LGKYKNMKKKFLKKVGMGVGVGVGVGGVGKFKLS